MHACVRAHAYVCMRACVGARMCACAHVCVCACAVSCTYMRVHVHACACGGGCLWVCVRACLSYYTGDHQNLIVILLIAMYLYLQMIDNKMQNLM